MNNTYPKRKPIRLKNYDYGSNGAYFITICTHNRKKLLSEIVGEGLRALPTIQLTEIGYHVKSAIEYMQDNYAHITVDNYIIMPNHIHLLVVISNESGGRGNPPLQDVIGYLKSYTTKLYGGCLWQRSFHDHIIRDDDDYNKIYDYIKYNHLKWTTDCFYVE